MNLDRWQEIERLYHAARETDPEQRTPLLESVCAGDTALRLEVESLLAQETDARRFLEAPAVEFAARAMAKDRDVRPADAPETMAGKTVLQYHILESVGEGGMGVVYKAEDTRLGRLVALKFLKPGLGGADSWRRFGLESQVLARLQHPGVAQIYEAGMADIGFGSQPYFAMEFIHGVPLRKYAESHHLGMRQRLELMATVCDGVEHAHQRGIIHRDLKPGNILVDQSAQPKILDFGVARVTGSDVQATRQTDVGQLIGTLPYMSPEHVTGNPLELDTRSDVYSLGVILYELLLNRLPYQLSPLLLEAVRVIREEQPKKPGSLGRAFRGDVETIIVKALEKDKARRYPSAALLAVDIRRYLADQPIMARPASASYQVMKFARRHKLLLSATAAIFAVLLSGVIVSTREAIHARQAEQTAQAVSDFLRKDLLAQASVAYQSGGIGKLDPDLKVRTALDLAANQLTGKFEKQPDIEVAIRDTIADTYIQLGRPADARKQWERVLEIRRHLLGPEHPDTLATMRGVAMASQQEGNFAQAEVLWRRALEVHRRVLGPEHLDTTDCMYELAILYDCQRKYAQGQPLATQVAEIRRRVLGPDRMGTLNAMNEVAAEYCGLGQYAKAEAILDQVVEISRRRYGPKSTDTVAFMDSLATAYWADGKYAQAGALFDQILPLAKALFGDGFTLSALSHLASGYQREGKFKLAEDYAGQELALVRRLLADHGDTIGSVDPSLPGGMSAASDLALAYVSEGEFAKSGRLAREALDFYQKKQPENWQRYRAETLLGASFSGQRRYKEAEPLLLEGYKGMLARQRNVDIWDQYHLDRASEWIVKLYQAWGKPEKVAEWRKEASQLVACGR